MGCSADQAQQYYADCLSSTATSTLCNGFTGASGNASCLTCLDSNSQSASMFGALVTYGGVDYANVAGCIALQLDDTSSTGCGAKLQAQTSCEELACSTQCPVTDDTSFMNYQTCAAAADMGACQTIIAAECHLVDGGIDGGPQAAAACEPGNIAFQGYYDAMSVIFCGDYAGDAGTD